MTLRTFIHEHDDLPAFHAGFLVLTFLAATLFNLGAFALLIMAHMSFDIVKYREVHHFSVSKTIRGVLRESMVDISLLLLGLFAAVYLHHAAGIIALSGLLRAEATILRMLGVVIPKLEIFYHFLRVIKHPKEHMSNTSFSDRHHPFSIFEILCLSVGIIAAVLLIASPTLLTVENSILAEIFIDELMPWKL